MDILTPILAAIIGGFVGAYFAFLWQNQVEKKREKKRILSVLMAHRGIGVNEPDWTKALNLVDLVFYDNKKIRETCHNYFKHLYKPLYDTGQHEKILLDLIYQMAQDSGFVNLRESDILDFYLPESYIPSPAKPAGENAR